MGRVLRSLRRKLRIGQLEREEYSGKLPVGNTDAMTAADFNDFDPSHSDGGAIPPNYVRPVDEGRPRK